MIADIVHRLHGYGGGGGVNWQFVIKIDHMSDEISKTYKKKNAECVKVDGYVGLKFLRMAISLDFIEIDELFFCFTSCRIADILVDT